METKDLDSYYPGYDDYCERNSTVPFDEFLKTEEQKEKFKAKLQEISELIDDEQYSAEEKIKELKTKIEESEEKHGRNRRS